MSIENVNEKEYDAQSLSFDNSSDSKSNRKTPENEDIHSVTDDNKINKDRKKKKTKKSKKDKEHDVGDKEKAAIEEKLSLLDPHDADILRSQTASELQNANLFTLFKFATSYDKFMVLLGIFFAVVHGVALPMFTLVVGSITNNFSSFVTGPTPDFQHQVNHNALYFVYIGVGMLVSSILESWILVQEGEILAGRYRKNYLKAVIRQNIAYFDYLGAGQVATRITNDTNSIQAAMSEKLGNIVQGFATFITAIIIAFTQQWKLACILLSVVAFNILCMGGGSRFLIKYQLGAENTYTKGSSIAEEALGSIRSTVAFGSQDRLAEKFDKSLRSSCKQSIKAGYTMGVMFGGLWMSLFMTYALAYWEGSRLIADDTASIGKIICVIVSMLIGSFQLGNVAPNIRFVIKGIAACKTINEAINRVPVIDGDNDTGKTIDHLKGEIVLQNVVFRYPSRPDVLVLPNFSLTIPAGHTVALVGSSGSGKSTIVGILERFYLPLAGSVTIDGVEINDLNLKWLRRQIGYVQQEPTLFADSIYENIAYGLLGTDRENVSDEEKRQLVIEACKEANALDFIESLTDGLDTNVGDRGFLLSGGQKQRIAIARAIISNPRILLLDEATSALDTKSEGIVQDALDKASNGRTTIVIAHRLSTIKDADKIVVMNKGEILEKGTHSELLNLNGHYRSLVDSQQVARLEKGSVNNEPSKLVIQEDDLKVDSDSNDYGDPEDIPGIRAPPGGGTWAYIKLLWRLNKNEQKILVFGCIWMILQGYCYSAMGQVTGHVIKSMMVLPEDYHIMRHNVNVLCWWFFFIGAMSFICTFIGISCVSFASARLVREVRLQLFRQFMRLDIAFFDHKNNNPGTLTTILAKEAAAIDGLAGSTFGQIMTSLTTLIGGVATGIPYSWRVGLVATSLVPILIGCGFLRVKVMIDLEARSRSVYEGSGSMAAQYTAAVRTVQSLTREDDVAEKYATVIDNQIVSSRSALMRSAILYGLSQGLVPWVIALIFWWGSTCLRKDQVGVLNYYVVFMCIILGAQAAGQLFSYAPDMGKAKQAASNVYRILGATPNIDVWSESGIVPDEKEVRGDVEFKDVFFRYPTRPQVPVLCGLNLKVEKGQYIALVGASGCGKSTTIGLTERFYDAHSGTVMFDGRDIRDYNLNALRSHIALVQQEPTLYSGTIRENIVLGYPGDESEVTDEMIYAVCRKANIHDFIMSLPDGYETISGSRGSLLSGGQKQRVAIARALIRNPKVLLLDEATSALDSESERIVQQALDEAAKGRTTIAIAHRLSTIQNADIIYVFDGGKIVEQGTHQTLLELNGRYAELVKLQTLEN